MLPLENLVIRSSFRFSIQDEAPEQLSDILAIASDSDSGVNYICVKSISDTCQVFCVGEHEEKMEFFAEFAMEGENVKVVSLKYLCEREALFVAMSNGEIMLVNKDSAIETVGMVEFGINDVQWSPDEEVFVIATGNSTIILMSREFMFINEVFIETNEFGKDEFINVGWGKKETQFHGSAGKQAALKSKEQKNKLYENDDLRILLSWRGDGNYFACSSVNTDGSQRLIRVFDRDCALISTSEVVPELENTLSWRPSGNLIASTASSPHGKQVVFFERNGLRHTEFMIKAEASFKVERLSWNANSNLLAVELLLNDSKKMIQIYASANYHWYLKQEFDIGGGGCFSWDQEIPNVAYFVDEKFIFKKMYFDFSVNCNDEFQCKVAVIDGSLINVTPFSIANIPPPMSYEQIKCSKPVVSVAFRGDSFAALLSDGSIDVFGEKAKGKSELLKRLKIAEAGIFNNILWPSKEFLVLVDVSEVGVDRLLHVSLDLEITCVYESTVPISHLIPGNGKVYYILDAHANLIEINSLKAQKCAALQEKNVKKIEFIKDDIFVYVTALKKLYCNKHLISAGCESFLVSGDYLIFTSHSHELQFVRLFDDFQIITEATRKLERGSSLVLNDRSKVVLQLPRGNVEIIYPRALVVNEICQCLNVHDYKEALELCRRNRIDMNIIVDYNPTAFLEHSGDFLKQIKSHDHLNLFLSELRNEDITTTLYAKIVLNSPKENEKEFFKDKINRVCLAIRNTLEQSEEDDFLNSILLTLLREKPQKIEDVLVRLSNLLSNYSLFDETMEFVKIFTDLNTLYESALGIYDLALALAIAQHCPNKDPKEYLPFIANLKSMDKYYQRFTLDDYLKRHEKALENLSMCAQKEDECLEYLQKKKLYRPALKIFYHNKEMYKRVMGMFAVYLQEESKYFDAAVAYQVCNQIDLAIECYKKALSWQQALTLSLSKKGKQETIDLAVEMAEMLEDHNRYQQAAIVYRDFAFDYRQAVKLFAKARCWNDALQVAASANDDAIVDTLINPMVQHVYKELSEDIDEHQKSFDAMSTRLAFVRQRKYDFNALEDEDEGDVEARFDAVDAMTDAGTFDRRTMVSSLVTGLTGASSRSRNSSKSRRKNEKRKMEAKEGSVFEEESLQRRLRKLIRKVNDMEGDISALITILLQFDCFLESSKLQRCYYSLKQSIKQKLREIFEPVRPSPHELPTVLKYQIENCLRDGSSRDLFDSIIEIYSKIEREELNKDLWTLDLLE